MTNPTLLAGISHRHRQALDAAIEVANDRRLSLFLVGGAVRDLLLGRLSTPREEPLGLDPDRAARGVAHRAGPPSPDVKSDLEFDLEFDLDLVVEGDGLAFAAALAERTDGTLRRHEVFLTAEVTTPAGLRIDVASARSESYPRPASLPEVRPSTLVDDLQRRDFTVNAMALALSDSCRTSVLGVADEAAIYDPFGGRLDLANRTLRVLHRDSFRDDPTRILRGLRLGLRLGLAWHEQTAELLRLSMAQEVFRPLSGSRLRRELALLLDDPTLAVEGLLRLDEADTLTALSAGLAGGGLDRQALTRVRDALRRAGGRGTVSAASVWLAYLAGRLDDDSRRRMVVRLDLEGGTARAVREAAADAAETLGWLASNDRRPHEITERLDGLSTEALVLVDAGAAGSVERGVKRYFERWRLFELKVSGRDLMAAGVPAGPAIGAALRRLRRLRLDGELQAREELSTALRLVHDPTVEAGG